MSDLLKKPSKKLLEKTDTPMPEKTFNRNSLFSSQKIKEEIHKDVIEKTTESLKKEKPQPKKMTTVKCTPDAAAMINAMTLILNKGTNSDLIEDMILIYLNELEEKRQLEIHSLAKILRKN